MRLLIVEDEKDLNRILVKKLTSEGYSVDSCQDGREAWDLLEYTTYDGIVLDIMLPGMDGLTILRNMRAASIPTPVLLLTARDSVADRVKGLDLGANDYLVKPFSFEELMARIRAMTRLSFGMVDNKLQAADLVMDCSSHKVERAGKEIVLSAKEYAILEYLLRNKGLVLSREKIENHVWNYDYEGGTNVVDVYIRYLRKKIDVDFEQKLIHTVRGRGYVIRDIKG